LGAAKGSEAGAPAASAAAAEEAAVVLTRNGKKLPVKYAPAKAVPKMPNALAVREYVTQQKLDPALDVLCFELVEKLFQFQERLRLRDPTKAKQRRRLVFGLREVKRGVKLGQVKCVVVAPNIDEGHFAGGLDDTVNEIIALGRASEDCTVLFALSKKKLGKALGKKVRVSAVGVYSLDGAYDAYKKIVKLLPSLS
jgi:selenocysteine insertion sequence-binding protein 2